MAITWDVLGVLCFMVSVFVPDKSSNFLLCGMLAMILGELIGLRDAVNKVRDVLYRK